MGCEILVLQSDDTDPGPHPQLRYADIVARPILISISFLSSRTTLLN